jgi:RHS repeat-associated protein
VTAEARPGGAYGYTYDAAGRLREFRLGGTLQAQYRYDAMGRQAVRTLTAGLVTIHSVFDADGRRIAEYDEATGALIREYVWMGWAPVAVIEGGQVWLVRADHIGRPVFATTLAGTQVWSAVYLPFGGVHTATGALPSNRFPGQWFQSETGLHQNWMRDYDPTTGRYIEADPLGLIAGASVYGYAFQSPLRWTDPTGENPAAAVAGVCRLFPSACAKVAEACAGAVIAGATWIGIINPMVGSGDDACEACGQTVESRGFPPGFIPADQGAREWGRKNGVGAREGEDRFHRFKQKHKGSGAKEKYSVNPETGDIVDGNGEDAGNLADED